MRRRRAVILTMACYYTHRPSSCSKVLITVVTHIKAEVGVHKVAACLLRFYCTTYPRLLVDAPSPCGHFDDVLLLSTSSVFLLSCADISCRTLKCRVWSTSTRFRFAALLLYDLSEVTSRCAVAGRSF